MNQDNSIPFEDLGLLYFPAVIHTRFGVQVGGVPSQNGIFVLWTPKSNVFCSCEPSGKYFPVFTLGPDRLCLD